MFNQLRKHYAANIFGGLLLILSSATAAQQADVTAMLKQADAYRLSADYAKVTSQVTTYQGDALDKTRLYSVYVRPNRESLVLFESKVEAGQKMLMLGDNYWLLMPKSRRPIRITPMQKLLGEASVGDISTLTWSDDYQGELIAQEAITLPSGQSAKANKLELTATTKGASYQRITLWLSEQDNFPIKADLYLRSGKLAKQAWFERGSGDSTSRVAAMTLVDQIQTAKKTVIQYQSIEPKRLDDKFYTPAYLARNPVQEG